MGAKSDHFCLFSAYFNHYFKIMVKIGWKQAKMIIFCTHFDPLFYQYFYDPLIDIDIDISQRLPIDIDIDIFQNCLIDIDIFQNCLINIDIDIFLNDHIDINIFQKCWYIDNRYSIAIYRTGLPPCLPPCPSLFLSALQIANHLLWSADIDNETLGNFEVSWNILIYLVPLDYFRFYWTFIRFLSVKLGYIEFHRFFWDISKQEESSSTDIAWVTHVLQGIWES